MPIATTSSPSRNLSVSAASCRRRPVGDGPPVGSGDAHIAARQRAVGMKLSGQPCQRRQPLAPLGQRAFDQRGCELQPGERALRLAQIARGARPGPAAGWRAFRAPAPRGRASPGAGVRPDRRAAAHAAPAAPRAGGAGRRAPATARPPAVPGAGSRVSCALRNRPAPRRARRAPALPFPPRRSALARMARSAAKSASVVSVSCPTAEMIGMLHAAIARTTTSSLNDHRSSIEPPPRATMTRSGRVSGGIASKPRTAAATSSADPAPCTLTGHTSTCVGQRSSSRWRMSRMTAPVGEVTTPIRRGRYGRRFLAEAANSPSPANLAFNFSSSAISAPSPASSMRSITI